jgi:hypothetical protein
MIDYEDHYFSFLIFKSILNNEFYLIECLLLIVGFVIEWNHYVNYLSIAYLIVISISYFILYILLV